MMAITFGTLTEQYDGKADDGDPTTPDTNASYHYPPNLQGIDGASFASSLGINTQTSHILTGVSNAVLGQHSSSPIIAGSSNKVGQAFSIKRSWWDKFKAWVGLGTKFSVSLKFNATITVNNGTGNIRVIAWLIDTAGGTPLQIQHSYDFGPFVGVQSPINVQRDSSAWKSISNPGSFSDNFTTQSIALGDGSYIFQSELNLMDRADGQVLIGTVMTTQLIY
jgi:hypothetical protein